MLVVEKDAFTREMYAQWLAYSGLQVAEAAAAKDAIEKARTLRPDLITTEIQLEDARSGLRLCADLKKFPENGWSLSGLQASLERMGRRADAAAVRARLDRVWGGADTALAAARPRTEAVVPAAR